jgi:hypothetical protein
MPKESSRQMVKLSQPMVQQWSRRSSCLSTALKRVTRFYRDSFLMRFASTWKWSRLCENSDVQFFSEGATSLSLLGSMSENSTTRV